MMRGGTVLLNGILCRDFAWPMKQKTSSLVAVYCQISVIKRTTWGGTTKPFNSRGPRKREPLIRQHQR